jgi:hypothetical protein
MDFQAMEKLSHWKVTVENEARACHRGREVEYMGHYVS